jgi:CheY-like chemotaxis protein
MLCTEEQQTMYWFSTSASDPSRPKKPTPTNCGIADEAIGQCILLVEDEPDILNIGKSALEKAGYRVLSAINGDVALVMLSTGLTIDLLITDIIMPGVLDGFGLARRVRDIFPNIPIIYTTGFSGVTAVRSKGAPFGATLQKPWKPKALIDLVDSTLRPVTC